MKLQIPSFLLIFLGNINFATLEIPFLSEETSQKHHYTRIYSSWLENFNFFGAVKESIAEQKAV